MAGVAQPARAARAGLVRAAQPAPRMSGQPPPISRSPRWCRPGHGPSSAGFYPAFELVVLAQSVLVRRVDPEDAAPGADPGHDELFSLVLLVGCLDHRFGHSAGNDENAFAIADDDIARQDRHTTTADRHVDVLGVMDRRRDLRTLTTSVGWQVNCLDRRRIPKRAVGDNAGGTALRDARRQNIAERRSAHIAAGVDDQHVAGPDRFDGDALLIGAIVELAGALQVFTHRDVAQGEGLASQPQIWPQRPDTEHEHMAESVLQQLTAQRRRADASGELEDVRRDAIGTS